MRYFTQLVAGAITAIALSMALVAPAAAAPRTAEYVALGDSYSAAGNIVNSLGCRAPDNVGQLAAAQLPGVSFADWACSGSTSDEIYRSKENPAQINGLSDHTRYVSVSTGGNDDGLFGELASGCVVGVTCTPATKAAALRKLARLAPRLDRAYSAIRKRAPHATVVVIAYLRVLPDRAAGCFIDPIIGQPNVDFINRVQQRMTDTIREVAQRYGFVVVNADDDGSHSICAPDGHRYVSLTGIGPEDYGTPVHPTLKGRLYTAALVSNAFKEADNRQ